MLFGTATINQQEHLEIGGVDTVALAKEFGTPLFIYDIAHIRTMAQGFKKTFESLGVKNKVIYASKAFSCLAIYQLLAEESLACDVVSGGELYTALTAGFDPENIEYHGNNKTYQELQEAVAAKVGTIVIDNFYEIEILSEILHQQKQKQKVLFRVSPGIEAETHEYILTGQVDSKFGFDVASGQAEQALQMLLADDVFEVAGVHCHIGSQIFDTAGFKVAIETVIDLLAKWQTELNFEAAVLNIGGGFGIRYTKADDPLPPAEFVEILVKEIKNNWQKMTYPLPEIQIEPGRSIVAEAGTTLYAVGAQKEIPGIRKYVAVDGGMGDNIRPALYNAEYDALLANHQGSNSEKIRIVGKYCESGDIVIRDIEFPEVEAGDLIAVTSTGAYGYSMASNYNRNRRPAVVFVENGNVQLAVRRESYQDLIRLDVPVEK
ncbi:diaminopimelate decarboxylase [Enterococcus sp. PF1-24]|uniref:diaminopimelate decarboxylase n=1 Tax=unclassified Enterococcus TaxID=2608891 RepID=UPI002474D515|nr:MULTISPECIES: diaminopimelate decarboxylase [unclassified Enterococcus]MDH6364034.1 diaminopimelate decarboxylase [Enterococcus sp. PFB1-1]MDH6401135.1 diaminopimelate decarboxylase [Enterococcus sp. PF1-24]